MADPDAHTGLVFEVERTLRASPDQVFRAWTDPGELQGWFAPDPAMAIEAVVDLRIGGRYRIRMGENVVSGRYEVIERPTHLVFTWRWETDESAEQTLVTVDLAPDGHGGTVLRLRHERLPDETQRANHAQGWEACLERLEQQLAG